MCTVKMERQEFRRRVYNSAPVSGFYMITSITPARFGPNEKPRTVNVNTLYEYESGCKEHRDCYGHLCAVNGDVVLPPHSMSLRSGDIATEYNKAAKLVFTGDIGGYVDAVKKTNLTKDGTMRLTMSTPVAGSCRLIATPQWEFGTSCIAISENLASRMVVCRRATNDDGSEDSVYVEDHLRENDWVIVVRPPSLHFGNTQPMKVKYWKHQCAGIHPESFSVFHGDFDGDEIQMYPVYEQGSINECESWEQLPLPAFVSGRDAYNSYVSLPRQTLLQLKQCGEGEADFIRFTTLSSKQIMAEPPRLAFGEYSRNKERHISGMSSRFKTRRTEASFVDESIRGMGDVARQQMSQGALGDMTRVAKVVASCFYRPATGGLHVVTRHGSNILSDDSVCDSGASVVRGMSAICAVAQQAALDSHRAESHDVTSHDFIDDIILGCNRETNAGVTHAVTLVETSSHVTVSTGKRWYKWMYTSAHSSFYLCDPSKFPPALRQCIVGAYNPIMLAYVLNQNGNVHEVCKRGVTTVCNYYGIHMSPVELNDIAHVFSYDVRASVHPITSREGMLARSLGWIETLLATDHSKLPGLIGSVGVPLTTTSAMFMSNFEDLKTRHD